MLSQEKIGNGIYSMWLQTEEIAGQASAGQFVSVYSRDGSRLLRVRSVSVRLIRKEDACAWFTGWQARELWSFRVSMQGFL